MSVYCDDDQTPPWASSAETNSVMFRLAPTSTRRKDKWAGAKCDLLLRGSYGPDARRIASQLEMMRQAYAQAH